MVVGKWEAGVSWTTGEEIVKVMFGKRLEELEEGRLVKKWH